MTTTMAVTNQLKEIIANQLDVNIRLEEIKDDVPLFEGGLGLDSIAIMEYITLIEEKFQIEFTDDELTIEPFQNMATLAAWITNRLGNNHHQEVAHD
jgi:acyl carrier protein